ncbi:uncharacterized protein LOC132703417 [Cylas formicarius]|uniref:uncharacterized protein LOC132703417 n=1 Tax=Cylas formicarius TaxID=197179 RepID=UPI0029588236|nr:uncharacterized protein LOC132703417 [Cylas formicarius]
MFELFLLTILMNVVWGAPLSNEIENDTSDRLDNEFDQKKYDVFYDQRQNGTYGNLRVDMDGVAIIWTPLSSLIMAAGLLDPPFSEGEYSESEVNKILNQQSDEKHITVTPNEPSSSTTVANPEVLMIEDAHIGNNFHNRPPITKGNAKRKSAIPSFIRPFLNLRKIITHRGQTK